jgi:hypothetical protein
MTEALIAGGTAIDAILGLVVLEALALLALRRRTGRGPAPGELLCFLAAGFALLLALRAALGAWGAGAIAAALLAALAAHLGFLVLRWRG